MADGSIRIETKLDNSALKQQIKELEKELKNIQKEQAKTEAQVSQARSRYDAEREFDAQFPEEFSHRQDIDERAAKELDPLIAKQEELNQKEQKYLQMLDSAKAKLAEQASVVSASKQVDDAVRGDAAAGKVQTQAQYNSLLDATAAKMAAIEAAAGRVAAQTGLTKEQILAANPAYQKLSDTMRMLKVRANEFGDEAQAAGNKASKAMKKAEKSTNKVGQATKRGISGFGKMQLVMMGIMFATRAISAATREYLAVNTELEGQVNTLKALWGQVLGPAIEWVINLLMQAISAVNTFVYALTGINFVARANEAALKKQAKATGAATKAAAQLAGFDEQTKLTDTSSSAANSDPVTLLDASIGSIPDFAQKLKEQILAGDWFGAGQTVGEALMDAIESVDWNNLGNKIGEILGAAVSFVLGFALSIEPETILLSLVDLVAGLFSGLSAEIQKVDWNEVGRQITDLLLLALVSLNPAALIVAILLTPEGTNLTKSAAELIGSVVGALAAAIIGMGERIGELALEIWETLKTHFDGYVDWEGTPEEIIQGLWNGIVDALKNVGTWIYNNIWVPFRDGFKKAFGIESPSKRMYEFGGYIIQGLWNGITEPFRKIGKWIYDNIWVPFRDAFKKAFGIASPSKRMHEFGVNIVEGLVNGIVGGIEKIVSACKKIWEAIKDVFSTVGTWFKDTFTQAWTNVKNVFSTGGKIFDGIKDGIASTFKTIVNGLIGGINKIIATPFNAINNMLNTIRSVTVLGVSPFKNLWSYNPLSVPQIPKLARGGIVNRPGRGVPAIIGEAGAEAVLPLENNTEWMDILAEKIGSGTITIPIYMDGKKMYTYMVDIAKRKAFAANGG